MVSRRVTRLAAAVVSTDSACISQGRVVWLRSTSCLLFHAGNFFLKPECTVVSVREVSCVIWYCDAFLGWVDFLLFFYLTSSKSQNDFLVSSVRWHFLHPDPGDRTPLGSKGNWRPCCLWEGATPEEALMQGREGTPRDRRTIFWVLALRSFCQEQVP